MNNLHEGTALTTNYYIPGRVIQRIQLVSLWFLANVLSKKKQYILPPCIKHTLKLDIVNGLKTRCCRSQKCKRCV